MIKNLLYSLLAHFLLILVVYLNFNLSEFKEEKTIEVPVRLTAFTPIKKIEEAPKEKTEAKKEIKKEKKPKAKNPPKKEEIKKARKESKAKKKLKKIKPVKKEEKIIKKEEAPAEVESIPEKEKEPTKTIDIADDKNSLENLDLSSREKFNIQSQLKFCYRTAITESKLENETKVITKVKIGITGKIQSNLDELMDSERYRDPDEIDYRNTIENIRRALNLCSPLRNLPLDKYYIWKEITLEFGK